MTSPLAQTFAIDSNITGGQPGLFVKAVDLYLKSCDPTLGVTVSIVPTSNGAPDFVSAPLASKRLAPISVGNVLQNTSPIQISGDSSVGTTFVFDNMAYLTAGNMYAIAVQPDGFNPNYALWSAKVGGTDVRTQQKIVNNWGSGQLFQSTNGATPVPLPTETLKFNLYRADFSSQTGTITLVNDDTEYLTVANVTSTFVAGEYVYQPGTGNGSLYVVAGNSYVIGQGNTSFAGLSAGQKVVLTGNVANIAVSSVVTINHVNVGNTVVNVGSTSTTSNVFFTVFGSPSFTSNNAQIQVVPLGQVSFFSPGAGLLYLEGSTAANSSLFLANNNLVGATSGCKATIASVDNKIINRLQPFVSRTVVQGTGVQLSLSTTTTANASVAPQNYDFNSTALILNNEVAVFSKSNEIARLSGAKSLQATLTLTSNSNKVTPIVDLTSQNLVVYHNSINNDTSSENSKNGNAVSRYVSKTVVLADGLDSEDLQVFITAHKPAGTDLAVYAKLLNASDPDPFDSKDWTRLQQTTSSNITSNPLNASDFYEFQYGLASSLPGVQQPGTVVVSTTGNTVLGTNTSFTTAFANGDLIELTSSGGVAQVAKITTVNSDTSIALATNSTFSDIATVVSTVTTPHAAYTNPTNSGIVRYISQSGAVYDSFKTFALKVDLTSSSTSIVPAIKDIRAIALSV